MKSPLFLRRSAVAAALFFTAARCLVAQDLTPPVVSRPIADFTVGVNSAPSVINFKKVFALNGVSGPIVRFSTTVGNIDVVLFSQAAPQTVATFLRYATAPGDNNSGVASYTNTLIQRAVPNFIVQGGGFYVNSNSQINQIVGRPTIPSEAGILNTRGTLAMALSTGPNSATGDWYFNVADNAMLDGSSDGGPFTVFGRAIEDISTLDAIEALPQRNFSSGLGPGFENVPLVNFDGSQQPSVSNLVYTNSITAIPLVAKADGSPEILKLKVKGNTNPGLVSASLSGRKLTLVYASGATGSATITIKAKNPATGSKVSTSFTVTVQ